MGHIDHGDAQIVGDAFDLKLHMFAQLFVERAKWFVHQHQFGLKDQGTGQSDPLLLTTRELRRTSSAKFAQFIGENNTLDGVVKEIGGGKALVELNGGELIDCKPINVSKVGERTRVSIRPERVEYNKDRMQEGAHTLKATVLEFIYMGDIFRTRLRVAGTDDFFIKTRNAPDQAKLTPGTEIEIGWLPEDCRALDA